MLEWTNPGRPFIQKHYSSTADGNMRSLQKEFTGKTRQLSSAKTTSRFYVVSPQSQLIYAGAIDSLLSARVERIETATNYVRRGLNKALSCKPIPTVSTRSYGCSVRYKEAWCGA